MSRAITGSTVIAAVVGRPVSHSLSPLIHNAWLEAAGLDGVYVAFGPAQGRFAALIEAMRGGTMRGVNVTLPLKEEALALADHVSGRAKRAGAANLLTFHDDGLVFADNTDGVGLLKAFAVQAPAWAPQAGPVVILGGGGGARGGAAALLDAGVPEVRLVNRTRGRADQIAATLGPDVRAFEWNQIGEVLVDATALINATSLGLGGGRGPDVPFEALSPRAVVMDMVYRPLKTEFLVRAAAAGFSVVDGLEMLIQQAIPAFEALFGQPPPVDVDVRALALTALGERP